MCTASVAAKVDRDRRLLDVTSSAMLSNYAVDNYAYILQQLPTVKQLRENRVLDVVAGSRCRLGTEAEIESALSAYANCVSDVSETARVGIDDVRRVNRINATFHPFDNVVFPVFLESRNHFCVLLVMRRKHTVMIFDSMSGSLPHVIRHALAGLFSYVFDVRNVTIMDCPVPQQTDKISCGVFSCIFLEYVVHRINAGGFDDVASTEFWKEWDPKQGTATARIRIGKALDECCCENSFAIRSHGDCTCSPISPSPVMSQLEKFVTDPVSQRVIGEDEEDDDTSDAEIFEEQLADLVAVRFDHYHVALQAIQHLFASSGYTLSCHGRRPPNQSGVIIERYRCQQQKGCPAAFSLYMNEREEDCHIKPTHTRHTHAPPSRHRTTAYRKSLYLKQMKDFMDTYKLSRLDAYCRVNPMLTKTLGSSAETRNVSRWYRGEEVKAERLQLAIDAKDACMLMEGDDGALLSIDAELSQEEFSGIVNEFRCLQAEDSEAYVSIQHDNLQVNYLFVTRGWQRHQGRLFGEMKVSDDKHGVSKYRFHLATLGIINNHGRLLPVAFALFDSPSTRNWKRFLEDARKAFSPEADGFDRQWRLTTVDQAQCIASAFDMVFEEDEGHELDTCLKHFLQLLADRHASCRAFWQPVGEKLTRLLNSYRVWESTKLESEIAAELNEFPVEFEVVREKLATFFAHAKSRVLHKRSCFTYGWNSQSGAESIFSLVGSLRVGVDKSLLAVVQRLLGLVRNNETRASRPSSTRTRASGEMEVTRKRLTPFAYDMFMDEYQSMVNYDIDERPDGTFSVRRLTDKHGNAHVVDPCGWKCDCNYYVWMGMPCCHSLLVRLRRDKRYVHDDAMFSSRWFMQQPSCGLLHRSPALSQALVTAPVTQRDAVSTASASDAVAGAGTRCCPVPVGTLPPLFVQRGVGSVVPSQPALLKAEVFADFSDTLESIGNDTAKLQLAHAMLQHVRTLTVSGASVVGGSQPHLPQGPTSIGRPATARKKGLSERVRLGENVKKPSVCSTCKSSKHSKKQCPEELRRQREAVKRRHQAQRERIHEQDVVVEVKK
eukprot:GHVU01170201.1.p1 GENE.GHVU01170201.1~~GHVU01170201.1.p1  ORF type:complete len:1099 (-),score=88.35 GHVU01170201.1:128-3304(-)